MSTLITDESVLREMSNTKSPSRKSLLFQHIITEQKDQSLLNAYKAKHDIDQISPKSPPFVRIASTEPLSRMPEGKYNHCASARISPHTLTRSQQNLLETMGKPPAKVCKAAPVHLKLSSIESFPETYKHRFFENTGCSAGDLADDPRKVINLLSGTSKNHLNIPGRAADFKNEVQWRMQLRN